MSTTLILVVLQLRNVGKQAVPNHRAGMGVILSVQHQNRGFDGRERARVSTVVLQSSHVVPRLIVSLQVKWLRLIFVGVRLDGIAVKYMSCQLADLNELIGRIGGVSRYPANTVPQVVIRAFLDSCLHSSPSSLIERATTDQDDRSGSARVLGGITKRQHGAPGVADNCHRRISAQVGSKLVKVGNVTSDSQR